VTTSATQFICGGCRPGVGIEAFSLFLSSVLGAELPIVGEFKIVVFVLALHDGVIRSVCKDRNSSACVLFIL